MGENISSWIVLRPAKEDIRTMKISCLHNNQCIISDNFSMVMGWGTAKKERKRFMLGVNWRKYP